MPALGTIERGREAGDKYPLACALHKGLLDGILQKRPAVILTLTWNHRSARAYARCVKNPPVAFLVLRAFLDGWANPVIGSGA